MKEKVMNINNIPQELKSLNQWVGVGIDSKVPMRVDTLYSASSTNPDTWCSFEETRNAINLGEITYPGFVFNDNGIIGIDIDNGFDEDGFISSLATDIISKCKSYTEKSRSGRGFHILVKGYLPFKGKNNLKGVEIYKQSRYFIMTGDTLLYDKMIDNQEAIDYIVDKYFTETRNPNKVNIFSKRIYSPLWKPLTNTIPLRPHYPDIPDGCRNICLTSLAGVLHTQGYSREQILDEILYCNKVACKPPLHMAEINNIVSSVTRYKR